MTRYTVTTCPGCGRRMAVNGRTTCVRASRTRLDDSAASWGTARDRVESEALDRVSQDPPVLPRSKASGEVMPGSRMPLDGAPSLGSSSG